MVSYKCLFFRWWHSRLLGQSVSNGATDAKLHDWEGFRNLPIPRGRSLLLLQEALQSGRPKLLALRNLFFSLPKFRLTVRHAWFTLAYLTMCLTRWIKNEISITGENWVACIEEKLSGLRRLVSIRVNLSQGVIVLSYLPNRERLISVYPLFWPIKR